MKVHCRTHNSQLLEPVVSQMMRLSWSSSVPPSECLDSALELGHDRFHQTIHRSVIILSFEAILVVLVADKASLNKMQIYKYTNK